MNEDERQQRIGITSRFWRPRLYEVARYRYNLLDTWGPLHKARVVAMAACKIASAKRILFFPQEPHPRAAIFSICLWAGHRIVTDRSEPHDGTLKWWTETLTPNSALPEAFLGDGHVINRDCEDISKSRLGQIFAKVFGYPLDVDPTSHRGPCLRKSDENATHDGRIIECPISAPEPGYVYEKLVDNRLDDGMFGVLRVPIFSDVIPYVALGHRTVEERFGTAEFATFLEPSEAFSPAEIRGMIELCAHMGVEYGELDVLRDRDDGRIYVCDVNPTPYGGTALRRLPRPAQREALSRMTRCLDRLLAL